MLDADLVLEGGGVRGIAHIGAITVLAEHGYTFHRAAGASAGAIAAAFVAAGMKPDRMQELMRTGLDYRAVARATGWSRLGAPGKVVSVLADEGIHDLDYLRGWLRDTLRRESGIETFADLSLDDPDTSLPEGTRYRLVCTVTDVSRGSLARLPWDYHVYGLEPERQPVADAVVASAAMPFFFRPVKLRWKTPPTNVSYLVDGGACSDFPIEILDRTDGRPPRWPTFGIKLQRRPAPGALANQVDGPLSLATSLLETVVNGNDQIHLSDPSVVARTIFIDTSEVPSTDFELTPDQQETLYQRGRAAATSFLQRWNWDDYLSRYGKDPSRAEYARLAQGLPRPDAAAAPDGE